MAPPSVAEVAEEIFETFGGLLSLPSFFPSSPSSQEPGWGALRHLFADPPEAYHPCGALILSEIRGATTVAVSQAHANSLLTVSCLVKRASGDLEEASACLCAIRRVMPASRPVNTDRVPVGSFFHYGEFVWIPAPMICGVVTIGEGGTHGAL